MTSKRLAYLLKMTESPTADSFAWYALALEHKGLGQVEEALSTFRKLRDRDPGYVPMYLMCGTMLSEAGRASDAREWLEAGRIEARARGNAHALGEIESALAALS